LDNIRVAIGVDMGGTNIRVAKISSSGQILVQITEHVPHGRDEQIAIIHNSVQRMMSADVQAVGFGFPGRLRIDDGIVRSAGFLDLIGIPLLSILKEQTGLPTFVDSDSNMAAFAEMKIGAGVGKKEVVMLTIGTGIGGAIISGGKLFYASGFSPQLGHLTVDMNGDLCTCGRRGCVETTSSGTSLQNLIAKSSLPKNIRAEDLLILEKNGDLIAREIVRKWAHPLRLAIDSIVATLGCELVLLGGGLGKAACEALLQITSCESPWLNYEIKPGKLGDKAGIIGAGLRALQE
jgi:glucokinase